MMKEFKKRKGLIIFLSIMMTIVLFWVVVNIIPPKDVVNNNPWIIDKVQISAHRGGSDLNPENTEKAFDYVIIETNYTDIVEIDVQLTKDNVLVICHDSDINDFALDDEDEDVDIDDHTYEELRKYNLGRNFVDKRNNNVKPYYNLTIDEAINEGLGIMSLESFLIKYNNYRDFKLFLEIKDSDEKAEKTMKAVDDLLNKYIWWKDRTLIITFDDNTIDYIDANYSYYKGALGDKAATQIALNKVKLDLFSKVNYECLHIPMRVEIGPLTINCATKSIIKAAHRRNQLATFYTINNEEDMKKLIEIKADVITTDAPDTLARLLGRI